MPRRRKSILPAKFHSTRRAQLQRRLRSRTHYAMHAKAAAAAAAASAPVESVASTVSDYGDVCDEGDAYAQEEGVSDVSTHVTAEEGAEYEVPSSAVAAAALLATRACGTPPYEYGTGAPMNPEITAAAAAAAASSVGCKRRRAASETVVTPPTDAAEEDVEHDERATVACHSRSASSCSPSAKRGRVCSGADTVYEADSPLSWHAAAGGAEFCPSMTAPPPPPSATKHAAPHTHTALVGSTDVWLTPCDTRLGATRAQATWLPSAATATSAPAANSSVSARRSNGGGGVAQLFSTSAVRASAARLGVAASTASTTYAEAARSAAAAAASAVATHGINGRLGGSCPPTSFSPASTMSAAYAIHEPQLPFATSRVLDAHYAAAAAIAQQQAHAQQRYEMHVQAQLHMRACMRHQQQQQQQYAAVAAAATASVYQRAPHASAAAFAHMASSMLPSHMLRYNMTAGSAVAAVSAGYDGNTTAACPLPRVAGVDRDMVEAAECIMLLQPAAPPSTVAATAAV